MRGGTTIRRGYVVLAACLVAWTMAVLGPVPGSHASGSFGVIIDDSTHKAVVFDSSSNAVLGATAADPTFGSPEGDCTIVGNKVWFTNYNNQLNSATLSTHTLQSPAVTIVNSGEEVTSVKKKKKTFLITSDGSNTSDPDRRLSVVDQATRHEVSTFDTGFANFAAQRAPDGSIISADVTNIHRLVISKKGKLRETVAHGGFSGLNNFIMPKTGNTFIALDFGAKEIYSIGLPYLQIIDSRPLASYPVTGAISPSGNIVYVQTLVGVTPFDYNPSSGLFRGAPFSPITVAPSDAGSYGLDATAVNPSGTTLYVSVSGAVNTYNALTGVAGPSITDAAIVSPKGICFPGQS